MCERVEGWLARLEADDFMAVIPDAKPLNPEQSGERIGNYKLLEKIGEGGFGVVWVADQERPVRRRVALKIIKLGMDTQEVIARFGQERQALAMMDHPHIAKVLDAGATDGGRPYFVMELVHGIKITDYCDQANLPTADRLALFIQVCSAVQHAHQKGIIHRDLKPSNILVTLHDGEPVPKVIDFGVAKATQQQSLTDLTVYTQFQQMIGTPLYMSPEQAEMSGLDIDTRSDIYSLGVLLYELLTGRTPFDPAELMRKGYDEIRRAIREQEPQTPSMFLQTMADATRATVAHHRQSDPAKLTKLVRGDLDWIVMKALEKDRARRYDTANGLAMDVQRHLTNEPVIARPPSTGYRFRKFARRNRAALRVAAGIATLLVAATTVSTWQALRATKAEKLAFDRLAEVTVERDQKERARKDSEDISTFLSEVFLSPDPARDGRSIRVAELLDRSAKKLQSELASQPARRAKLQATLGETYLLLGVARNAIPLLEEVSKHHLASSGPEHGDTLMAMNRLARAYFEGGGLDKALKMQDEVVALCRKVRGPAHLDTLTAMGHLANFYQDAGRGDQAIQLHEEALALYRKTMGPEHPETLTAIHNLAVSYAGADREDETLKLTEEVLSLRRKVLGKEHPDTLRTMINVASSYDRVGREDEAIQLGEEGLALCRKVLGPEHPDTLLTMENLANSYHHLGRKDEALVLHEEALALRRKVSGPEHSGTLGAMFNLAISYDAACREDEALKLREKVLEVRRRVYGLEHPKTLLSMNVLPASLDQAGRHDEALKMREDVLPLFRKVFGPENPNTLGAMTNLAISYGKAGRLSDAIALQEESLAIKRRVLPRNHRYRHYLAIAFSNMADLYERAGRKDEAEKLRAEFAKIAAETKKD